ncbi:SnoaL-like domain-containing protein [Singulisphaera sp. GP187]|uniref:nuclear transport factor 2 family protein n=1 Tax=Singulisphaera sp. GP187 TaxID=1882752 RepID=UPI00092BCA0F|nr:nuclear transport factor 2 family protein [Singulisphaera sp. GP187]SIO61658.1 SnoaL-like domain-containing protein [Singulisphaera sp. GP187]
MMRTVLVTLALVLPTTTAWTQESDAKKLAQEIVDKGSALYDTKDAPAMAATYTEDAKIHWYSKKDSGEVEEGTKNGRAEIEGVYRDLFKDPNNKTTSKNTVEHARFVASDILIIEGVFQPNVAATGKFPFVQVRIKEGDKWLMKTLEFFAVSQD